jgi:ankyrin repeat protein
LRDWDKSLKLWGTLSLWQWPHTKPSPKKKLFLKSVCTTLTKPFLFADSVEMGRAFKKLYLKLCQMPFAFGQNDHQKAVVKFILDYANDNNPINEDGETPLHTAAQNNDMLSVLLILHHYQDKTYLHLADRYDYLPYAKDKNPADFDGQTPLHWAAMFGYLEIVKLLLEHATDKNRADMDGKTPLHLAVEEGNLETVKLLLQYAKDKNPADNKDKTPLHLAVEDGNLETVKLLLEHAKDKNPEDEDGWTPLHLAAEFGHLEIVNLLLPYAKDKNPEDKKGRTPLYFARRKGYDDIVKSIQDFNKDLFKS